jgi:outer membrane protein
MTLRSRFAALVVAAPLLLSTSAIASEFKAAYVDLQRALLEVDEGRQAKDRLQKLLQSKQTDLDKEQEKLRKEKDLLDKQASAMSEEVRIQKQTELQQKVFALAQKWENGQKEMAQKERTELQAIFTKMDPLIAEIAQREGITMVFEKTDSGVVYAPSNLDLTNELVRLFNARNKTVGAGSKGAPKSTPTKK